MNASQKRGVGILVALLIFAVPAVLDAFGVALPSWVSVASSIISTVCGILGITVQNPFKPAGQ